MVLIVVEHDHTCTVGNPNGHNLNSFFGEGGFPYSCVAV